MTAFLGPPAQNVGGMLSAALFGLTLIAWGITVVWSVVFGWLCASICRRFGRSPLASVAVGAVSAIGMGVVVAAPTMLLVPRWLPGNQPGNQAVPMAIVVAGMSVVVVVVEFARMSRSISASATPADLRDSLLHPRNWMCLIFVCWATVAAALLIVDDLTADDGGPYDNWWLPILTKVGLVVGGGLVMFGLSLVFRSHQMEIEIENGTRDHTFARAAATMSRRGYGLVVRAGIGVALLTLTPVVAALVLSFLDMSLQ